MIITKNGKQLKNKEYKNYRVISGTVDNKNPKAIYLSLSAWGDPQMYDEDVDYNIVIRDFTRNIKQSLLKNLNRNLFFSDRCIIDFDMRESGITYGKKSFMNCEITLFQKNLFKLQEKNIQEELDKIGQLITTEVLDNSEHFKFTKSKK